MSTVASQWRSPSRPKPSDACSQEAVAVPAKSKWETLEPDLPGCQVGPGAQRWARGSPLGDGGGGVAPGLWPRGAACEANSS